MMNITKIVNVSLIILTGFLSITGALGGIALMANFYAPPTELLQGSVFNNFFIPGLALSIIVGGSALSATVHQLRKRKFANLFTTAAGVIIMFFEFVEVMIIGSPEGPARFMQIFYFGLGTLIVMAALGIRFLDLIASPRN
jgi:hypothetical protein